MPPPEKLKHKLLMAKNLKTQIANAILDADGDGWTDRGNMPFLPFCKRWVHKNHQFVVC